MRGSFDPRLPALYGAPSSDDEARLERSKSVPLYFQLAEILTERIEAGRWKAGERFPSEREIWEEFHVSRTVIRPALDLLVGDGLLVRIKGRGTFVTPPKLGTPLSGLTYLSCDGLASGLEIGLLSVRQHVPDGAVHTALELEASTAVTNVTALLLQGGTPVGMWNSFIAAEVVRWFDGALQGHPEQNQIRILAPVVPGARVDFGPAEASIALSWVSEWEAAQLGMAAGDPCFLTRCIEKVWAGDHLRPAEYTRIVTRADAMKIEVELARATNGTAGG